MLRPLAFSAALCALPGGALSDSAWATDESGMSQVRILEGWRSATGTHVAGWEISLAPGWKTYWRVPGPGGIPPEAVRSGSENTQSLALRFPEPEVFTEFFIKSYG